MRPWQLGLLALAGLPICDAGPRLDPATSADEPGPAQVSPADGEAHQAMLGVLVPEDEVVLVSSGFAKLARLDFAVGDHVEAGQLVAEMELHGEQTEQQAARAAAAAAKAELERLELELSQAAQTRADLEELEAYVSRAELRGQRYAEDMAAARKRRAGAELRQQRSKMEGATARIQEADLRAPFDGVVSQLHVDAGATLSAGEPVVEILSDTRVLRFAVPEREAAPLELGARIEARFRVEGSKQVITVSGRVISIAPEVDAGTRLIFAEAKLDEGQDAATLRVGSVAHVHFAPG